MFDRESQVFMLDLAQTLHEPTEFNPDVIAQAFDVNRRIWMKLSFLLQMNMEFRLCF